MIVERAREFALEMHGDQKYAGGPYEKHLQDVVNTLIEFGYTSDADLASGWLHDTLEDATPVDITRFFTYDIYDRVWAVTGIGKTRAERTANTIGKLHICKKAVPLKMADRLANMRFSNKNSRKHINMYIDELPKYGQLFFGPMYEEMQSFQKIEETNENITFYNLVTKPSTGRYGIS